MGIGSLVFVVPHFIAGINSEMSMNNKSDDNICRLPRSLEQDMGGLGRLSQGLPPNNLRPDNCIKVRLFQFILTFTWVFVLASHGVTASYLRTAQDAFACVCKIKYTVVITSGKTKYDSDGICLL